jgi:hypothetical protein
MLVASLPFLSSSRALVGLLLATDDDVMNISTNCQTDKSTNSHNPMPPTSRGILPHATTKIRGIGIL